MTFCVLTVIAQKDKFIPKYSSVLKPEKGITMLRQCSRSAPDSVENFFILENNDIQRLESNFRKILLVKSSGCCKSGKNLKNISRYVYQYIGVIIKSKKYIYINAFCVDDKSELETFYKTWKEEPMIICDGGEDCWGALFDI